MKRKALWNQIIENLEAILDAPDMDCDCDDCAVARHIMNLLNFPDDESDIDPHRIRSLITQVRM